MRFETASGSLVTGLTERFLVELATPTSRIRSFLVRQRSATGEVFVHSHTVTPAVPPRRLLALFAGSLQRLLDP